jgi:hypothetical protein
MFPNDFAALPIQSCTVCALITLRHHGLKFSVNNDDIPLPISNLPAHPVSTLRSASHTNTAYRLLLYEQFRLEVFNYIVQTFEVLESLTQQACILCM